jgi:hypothetical protein
MMKSTIFLFLTTLGSITTVDGFVSPTTTCSNLVQRNTIVNNNNITPSKSTSVTTIRRKASENEEFLPETSFGAEVVPEGQRPVNEYLDMKRAPLFGWASNEVGTDGLLQRLAMIYVVVFATM